MKTYHPKCWQACEGILELTDTAYGNSNCTVVHFLEDKRRTTMYDSALTCQGIFFKRKEIMGPHEELPQMSKAIYLSWSKTWNSSCLSPLTGDCIYTLWYIHTYWIVLSEKQTKKHNSMYVTT